jgi:hypothetical protein
VDITIGDFVEQKRRQRGATGKGERAKERENANLKLRGKAM